MHQTDGRREELLSWLFSLENFGIKLGLENMRRLMSSLGNPEGKYGTVHVAGTNGKGSVCAYLSSMLQHEGYRTGLYTSPHLVEFEERIKVDGVQIQTSELLEIADRVRACIVEVFGSDRGHITFFEVATAIAFIFFERKKVDIAVIEVGLGGRLDATNIITPELSVITHIEMEHTEYLGNTLGAIASEKAGIIKPGIPAVISEEKKEALESIYSAARERNSPLYRSGDLAEVDILENRVGSLKVNIRSDIFSGTALSALWGEYQIENIRSAVAAVDVLSKRGIFLGENAVEAGLREVIWRGRLQLVRGKREFILDGAHNPDAARALIHSLRSAGASPLDCIFGVLKDKNVEEMAFAMKDMVRRVMYVEPETPRARSAREVIPFFSRYGIEISSEGKVAQAMERALDQDGEEPFLVTGSLRVVGEAMQWYHSRFGSKLWQ